VPYGYKGPGVLLPGKNWYISLSCDPALQAYDVKRYTALSDHELLHLLRQDDELALSELYQRYWDKMLSVACHRLDDPEGAEEVVQDVFFGLWKRRETLDIKFALSTYLAVAVKYRIINLMDKQYRLRRKREGQMIAAEDSTPSVDEYIFEKELWERIEATIKRLPGKCQIVFRMSREEGLTNKQIAGQLNISEKTVEGHITTALKDLRSNLSVIIPAVILSVLEQDRFHF
jgi:RNA polymerase sigma-70 factor (family 1)